MDTMSILRNSRHGNSSSSNNTASIMLNNKHKHLPSQTDSHLHLHHQHRILLVLSRLVADSLDLHVMLEFALKYNNAKMTTIACG